MANRYLNNYSVVKVVNGQTDLYKSDAGEPQYYETAQAACDAVKNLYGNTGYRVFQEIGITKTDTPDVV